MKAPANAIVKQAAQWLVMLDDQPEQYAQFEAWCRADPRHMAAARSLEGVLGRVAGLPPMAAKAALQAEQRHRRQRSRFVAGALLALALLVIPAGLYLHEHSPDYLLADMRTDRGQWQERRLEDGSRLSMGSHTAVDLNFSVEQRILNLRQGDILVDVAADARRPFIVRVGQTSIRALGTRFIVETADGVTWLEMLESRVEVQAGGQRTMVTAGQRLRIDGQGMRFFEPFDAADRERYWQRHQLVVEDVPLAQVLATVQRQRSGYLHYDAASIAHLRVSATLPLDDPDQALRLLAKSFNLRIKTFTPWLARLSIENEDH